MENNKNAVANVLLVVVVIAAVFLVGFLIFGKSGANIPEKLPLSASKGADNLSNEDQNDLAKERQAFFTETQDLRQEIHKKRVELQNELSKKNPDVQKVAALHKDISKLAEEFDQKRLAFILKMKKINPNFGRMGLRVTEKDDDDINCPNYGRQYSHHKGRRHGYGMGPGYGRGPGSMGRAPEQGETGQRSGRLETPLNKEGARAVVENYLQSTRNPNLKLGKITEQGVAFGAEIVTKDGSLVDKLLVDKSTGWIHPAN
jgi:hypothetical protein